MNRKQYIALAVAVGFLPLASAQSTSDLFRITDASSRTSADFHQVSVPMGKEVVFAEMTGPGKVTYFYITDDTVGKWYPGLDLKVYWNEAKELSIDVPLADFSEAIGGKSVDYQSLPMQINHACFMCYLPMPFSKRAKFALVNDGDRDYSQKMAYGVDFEESPAYATEHSRLHCEWRRSKPVRFRHSLKVEIQNQHDNINPTTGDADDYISLAFWYQDGPQKVATLPTFKERTAPSFSNVR